MKHDNKDQKKCADLLKDIDCTLDINEVQKQTLNDKYNIQLSACYDNVDFNLLTKLSELFKTKLINIGSETRNGGFCETCSYEYSVVVIRIDQATIQ